MQRSITVSLFLVSVLLLQQCISASAMSAYDPENKELVWPSEQQQRQQVQKQKKSEGAQSSEQLQFTLADRAPASTLLSSPLKAPASDVPVKWKVIWLAIKEWEAEYIDKVLLQALPPDAQELPSVPWCDPLEDCLADGIVIIYGREQDEHRPRGLMDRLLRKARERGSTTIVIHISDERCDMDYSYYPLANLVIRQYWCEPQSLGHNVVTIPCGLKDGWNYTHQMLSTAQRRCVWTFFGHVSGPRTTVRHNMKQEMDKVPGSCAPPLASEVDNNHNVKAARYTAEMCSTVFAPAPRGYGLETFRFSEALECGCIPIVDDAGKVFHKYMPGILDHVITTDMNWTHTITGQPLAEFITSLLKDPVELERQRLATMRWYRNYKHNIQYRISDVVASARPT